MFHQLFEYIVFAGVVSFALVGCKQAKTTEHPVSQDSIEPVLLHASGACLAKVVKLEEHDNRPEDGNHEIEVWLEIEESSGGVPERLNLVIHHGGHLPVESIQNLEAQLETMVLRHDSLQLSERCWFVFSEDYDPSKYPATVAGWWRYDDGDVPHDVIDAIQQDRFSAHPVWDKTLNVVYDWQQSNDEILIRVRDADSLAESAVRFNVTLPGELEWVKLSHWPVGYEMEWPEGEEGHFVHVSTISELPGNNEFKLSAGRYRLNYAFEIDSGKRIATWVAKHQEVWLLHAFRQYDRETGDPITIMKFDLLDSGGIDAGGDKENWYRRIMEKYDGGKLLSEQVFRHPHIIYGTERIYSGSGWLPVDDN